MYIHSLLSFIRTLSVIVHLFSVELQIPDTTDIFFSALFELCAFDFIPTDLIYEKIFEFNNEPLTATLDAVGYASQYIIFNLGSIFIFMVL